MDEQQRRRTIATVLEGVGAIGQAAGGSVGGRPGSAIGTLGSLAQIVAGQLRVGRLDRAEWVELILGHSEIDEVDTESAETRIRRVLRRLDDTQAG